MTGSRAPSQVRAICAETNCGRAIAGMPSLGGPPDSISDSSTVRREKSVLGQSVASDPDCANAAGASKAKRSTRAWEPRMQYLSKQTGLAYAQFAANAPFPGATPLPACGNPANLAALLQRAVDRPVRRRPEFLYRIVSPRRWVCAARPALTRRLSTGRE